jgi:hypothetical protein
VGNSFFYIFEASVFISQYKSHKHCLLGQFTQQHFFAFPKNGPKEDAMTTAQYRRGDVGK